MNIFKKVIVYSVSGIACVMLVLYLRSNSSVSKPKPGTKIVIIGATSGIGAALTRECVTRGYQVGATGRRTDLLEKLNHELADKLFIQTMDVVQPEQAQQQLSVLINTMRGMDVLVVNAGVINAHLDWQNQKHIVDVNVVGFLAIVTAATEYFMRQGTGHIVGISSLTALRGIAVAPAYSASKAFESNYLEGLRARFTKMNIPLYVTDIQPALINTAMTQDAAVAQPEFTNKWGATPAQAAREICDAIESRKKHAYVTYPWRVVAWLFKLLPDWIFYRLF